MLLLLARCIPLCAQASADLPAPPAESKPYLYIGAIAGYSIINNTTTLAVYQNLPDCGTFSNGDARGIFFGLTVDYPFLSFLDLSARALYVKRPASLTSRIDNGLRAYDPVSGTDVPYILENVFTSELQYLSIDAGVRLKPFELLELDLPLYLRASVDAGDPIFGNSYTETEELVQPRSRTFPDGTQRHVIRRGELTTAGTTIGASLAAGYNLQVGLHTSLCLEAGYRYGVNSVVRDQSWKVHSYYGALALSYAFAEEEPPPAPAPEIPVPEIKPEPAPIVKKEVPPLVIRSFSTTPLEVQETVVTETYPLLPYVFFDSSSAELRDRYTRVQSASMFREKDLLRNTLGIYYNLLNIIAKRMLENPNSTIRITGTTDGREHPSAAQRIKLSEQRAAVVAAYLQSEWHIAKERITIAGEDKPQLLSNPAYNEGLEENRRVEISSDNPSILAPVVHARFMEYAPVQSSQVFSIRAEHPEQAEGWEASIRRNGQLARISGKGLVPETVPFTVDSAVMVSVGKDIAARDSLEGVLSVLQKDGSTVTAGCRFPIIKTQNTYELSRLSLIVFDFDRSDISNTNKEMMKRFVTEAIGSESKVSITGSTDRLGEMDYNQKLSQSRAEAAKEYLLHSNSSVVISSCKGVGASNLPYDNNLPEGRYYCRTVSIVVQTPLKK